jgi:hypothetical protein
LALRLKLRTDSKTHCENRFCIVPDSFHNVPDLCDNAKMIFLLFFSPFALFEPFSHCLERQEQ